MTKYNLLILFNEDYKKVEKVKKQIEKTLKYKCIIEEAT